MASFMQIYLEAARGKIYDYMVNDDEMRQSKR